MIDMHSHLLPGIDDGSRSREESFAMLSELKRQGASIVAATPHFYASEMIPDVFFEKRQAAFEELQDTIDDVQIDLRLGAEVLYFEGMRNFVGLKDFCISGTELLLLEMPFSRWSERAVRDITELNSESGLTVVLAHIDRYLRMQPERTWETLAGQGVLMQVNAEAFINRLTRRKALRLFKNGFVHFIGSDCHDTVKRPPNMASAMDIIEKNLGKDALAYLENTEYELFRSFEGVL